MELARVIAQALHAHNRATSAIAPAVIACTGGGNSLASSLLNTPGASGTILSATQPYSRAASSKLAGANSAAANGVGHANAFNLAQGALAQAKLFALQEALGSIDPGSGLSWAAGGALPALPECVGLACTASLAADKKQGPHRAYIASVTDSNSFVLAANLHPQLRAAEDAVVSTLAAALLAEVCGVPLPGTQAQGSTQAAPSPSWLHFACSGLGLQLQLQEQSSGGSQLPLPAHPGNVLHATWQRSAALPHMLQRSGGHAHPVKSILCLPSPSVGSPARCIVQPRIPPGTVLLPGSFNPLHAGHEQLAVAALRFLQGVASSGQAVPSLPHTPSGLVLFELSATNADKLPLEGGILGARLAQFMGPQLPADIVGPDVAAGAAGGGPKEWPQGGSSYRSQLPAAVVVTDAPLFVQKGPLFPGCIFVLGVDTVVRLVDAKYYGGDREGMLVQLGSLLHAQCRVLVAGRVMDKGPAAGSYLSLCDVLDSVPPALRELFIELPQDSFRMDVSSSELRKQGPAAAAGGTTGAAAVP